MVWNFVVDVLSIVGFAGVVDVTVFKGKMGVFVSSFMPWNK